MGGVGWEGGGEGARRWQWQLTYRNDTELHTNCMKFVVDPTEVSTSCRNFKFLGKHGKVASASLEVWSPARQVWSPAPKVWSPDMQVLSPVPKVWSPALPCLENGSSLYGVNIPTQ